MSFLNDFEYFSMKYNFSTGEYIKHVKKFCTLHYMDFIGLELDYKRDFQRHKYNKEALILD